MGGLADAGSQFSLIEVERNFEPVFDYAECLPIKLPDMSFQARNSDGSNLFTHCHGIQWKTGCALPQQDLARIDAMAIRGVGARNANDHAAVLVDRVPAHDDYGACASLLRAAGGVEEGDENVAPGGNWRRYFVRFSADRKASQSLTEN